MINFFSKKLLPVILIGSMASCNSSEDKSKDTENKTEEKTSEKTVYDSSLEKATDWFKAGSDPGKYEMGIEKGAGQEGKNAATIRSIEKIIDPGFGTLMQDCLPDKYLGKRVRMSGYMKSKDVTGWAGFWFRVDPELSFDNMHDGKKNISVTGTTDWTKYEIVLDVPKDAVNLAYGALLVETGQIWFSKITFEIVDTTVATTGLDENGNDQPHADLKEPSNLDFDK